jgi:hypothetical protein
MEFDPGNPIKDLAKFYADAYGLTSDSKKFDLYIFANENDAKKYVGICQITFGVGNSTLIHADESLKEFTNKAYYAVIEFIKINEEYRNQGYSKKAMKLLSNFFDLLRIDYSALIVVSTNPKTAQIYVDSGYKFMNKTLNFIKLWGQSINIADENEAIKKFLEDSTISLGPGRAVYMMRKRGQ